MAWTAATSPAAGPKLVWSRNRDAAAKVGATKATGKELGGAAPAAAVPAAEGLTVLSEALPGVVEPPAPALELAPALEPVLAGTPVPVVFEPVLETELVPGGELVPEPVPEPALLAPVPELEPEVPEPDPAPEVEPAPEPVLAVPVLLDPPLDPTPALVLGAAGLIVVAGSDAEGGITLPEPHPDNMALIASAAPTADIHHHLRITLTPASYIGRREPVFSGVAK